MLRDSVATESVDLIYLDPPFNSQATYNLLFRSPTGAESQAQIEAFEDSWHWGQESETAFDQVMRSGNTNAADLLRAMRAFLGETDMMAYLAMMIVRLIELHRVLKATGSLYLHCDPTASHYLKLLLDGVIGRDNFRNEIIWRRSHAHNEGKQGAAHFGRVTDTLLFYTKSAKATWTKLYTPYNEEYVARDYRRVDENGRRFRISDMRGPGGAEKGNPYYEVMGVSRYWAYSREEMSEMIREGRVIQTKPGAVPQYKRYLDEMPGVPLQSLWDDLPVINNRSTEFLGYPTQKPVALLEAFCMQPISEVDHAGDVAARLGPVASRLEVLPVGGSIGCQDVGRIVGSQM